jgi:hypothetical protein
LIVRCLWFLTSSVPSIRKRPFLGNTIVLPSPTCEMNVLSLFVTSVVPVASIDDGTTTSPGTLVVGVTGRVVGVGTRVVGVRPRVVGGTTDATGGNEGTNGRVCAENRVESDAATTNGSATATAARAIGEITDRETERRICRAASWPRLKSY